MINYFKKSFTRKKARRVFQEYPHAIATHSLKKDGKIEFADWQNPLVIPSVPNQEMVDFFRKFIPQGSLCIDIGAYIGDTAVPMALAAGKEGLTLAFEPNPHTYRILEINAGLNKGKTNIKAFPFAITDTEGDFYFNSSEASFSNGGLSAKANSRHGKYVLDQKVTGKKLETLLHTDFEEWVHKISLIKIDVEGHDKDLIRSISSLLDSYHPNVIAECNKSLSAEERYELFDNLADKGYHLYYFDDFGVEDNVVRLDRNSMVDRQHFDLYAVHPSKQ